MSRTIRSRGPEWPLGVQATQTFDTNFTYDPSEPQGGLDWQVYPHHCFPWLATADENDLALRNSREFIMTAPNAGGEERPIRVIPANPQLAININNEMSAIVWRCDWETYGLPDMARVVRENGVDFCRLEAHLTPAPVADEFTTIRDQFIVKSVDPQQKTVTLRGKKYYRKRKTSALSSDGSPQYDIGSHWGFQRYMRDELNSDAERNLDEFKVRQYNYAFAQFNKQTYRYSRVVDLPVRDYRAINYSDLITKLTRQDADGEYDLFRASIDAETGIVYMVYRNAIQAEFDLSLLKVVNQSSLDTLAALTEEERSDVGLLVERVKIIEQLEVEPSEHVLHFQIYPDGIKAGDKLNMIRRLPYVTTMLATLGTFSQKGGYWDFRLRFDRKKRQFSAPFLWTNYLETFIRRFLQHLKELEIDVKELPGFTTPFMNTHRPQANRDPAASMLDYCNQTDREPVMSHPEWTESNKQQHQLLIPFDSPDYVDSGAWHDIRVAICLEGNPLGFPANSVVWYERTADGKFKFTAGCALSPDAHNNVLDLLQCFLCNPVDGDFVADMEYFAPGAASTDETLPIKFDIAHVKAYQFLGFEPGGAGLPDPSGQYPNGMRPTPNDITGSSGSPVVGVPAPKNQRQSIVSGYSEAGVRDDGSKLLIAKLQ